MLAQPSMIKRPVLDLGGGKLLVGFKPEIYDKAVAAALDVIVQRRPSRRSGRDVIPLTKGVLPRV